MHDYLVVDRAAPVSSSIGRTASVEDAVVNIRNFLESYRQYVEREREEGRGNRRREEGKLSPQ